MQQTEKYKLNLIEPTAPFLPDRLNQNTRKMEADMIMANTSARSFYKFLVGSVSSVLIFADFSEFLDRV